MHEYGVTERIMNMAIDVAKTKNATKITDIYLVVGTMTGLVGEAIQMYFDIMSEETLAEGAVIHFKYVTPKFYCKKCDEMFERNKLSFDCPTCGQAGSPTEIGKEFFMENIEIEV